MIKNRLLLLDDSKLVITTLLQSLSERKLFEPHVANSYQEAISLLKKYKFTAAILDLELPDANDAEQIDYVLKKEIPVIVLTGTFNENLQKLVRKKPIIDYIIKETREDIQNAVVMAENLLLYTNKRVLIVDDSKLARLQLKEHLNRLGFFVQEAESANSALETIKKQAAFDLITIDYEMPEKNGIQFVHEVKKLNVNYPSVYFGVYGSNSDNVKIRFLKSGAHDVFVKPLQKETFNIKLANAFSLIQTKEKLGRTEHIFNEYIRALDNASITTKGDKNGKITYASKAFCELTGYSSDELIGRSHNIFRHPQTPKDIFSDMWNIISHGEIWSGVLQNRKKSGENFFITLTIVPFLNVDNEVTEYISFRNDITELVQSKKELQEQFYTDSLTHLSNRNRLYKDIEICENPALTIIHINSFKDINSFYGDSIGDEVIRVFSENLFNIFYPLKYRVYRLSGVEFALLLNNKTKDKLAQVQEISNRLKGLEDARLFISEYSINISLSAGISYNTKNIAKANMALKVARKDKKIIQLFDDSIDVQNEYEKNLKWTSKIKQAIKRGDILCYYQPICNNVTGEIKKYESLVRLKDEDGTIISPFHFLEIAKQSGLYSEITRIVIDTTFEKFRNTEYDFSINLTVDDILNDSIREFLLMQLKNMQGNTNHAIIELVESSGIESYEEVSAFISQIKGLGAYLAIDDFGTGYSNFEYLVKLEPNFVKIDGSLIKMIDTNRSMYNLVKTMVDFSKSQSYEVIGEFVSSESILNYVKELGIDYSQGYYIGEPKQELIII